jgi:integrase
METQQVAEQFYRHVQRKGLSETYCRVLRYQYTYIAERCGTFPTPEALSRLVEDLRDRKLSASWIANVIKAMRHVCAFLEIDMPDIRAPKAQEKRITYLTELEASRLLNACQDMRDYALLCVLLYGGLRRTEAASLRWEDVDLGERIISVRGTKTHRTADVPISEKAVRALEQWKERSDGGAVFGIRPDRVGRIVKKYAQKAGIRKNVSTHTLRHTLATNLLLNGADVTLVQKQLRHTDLKSTLIYLHITTDEQKKLYDRYTPSF